MQLSKSQELEARGEVGEQLHFADLAFRRAHEVLKAALEESRRLREEASEEARVTREQAMTSLMESMRALKRAAETQTASLLEEAAKEAAEIRQRGRSEATVRLESSPSAAVIRDPRVDPKLTPAADSPDAKLSVGLGSFLPILALVLGLPLLLLLMGSEILPFRVVAVSSGSMEPAIPVGSVIVLKRVQASEIGVGDIITFHPPGHPKQLDTHRVVGIEDGAEGKGFITQGDANPGPDAWQVPAVGEGWRHTFHLPYLGYTLTTLKSLPTQAALLNLPILALGLAILIPLWFWPSHAEELERSTAQRSQRA